MSPTSHSQSKSLPSAARFLQSHITTACFDLGLSGVILGPMTTIIAHWSKSTRTTVNSWELQYVLYGADERPEQLRSIRSCGDDQRKSASQGLQCVFRCSLILADR